MERTEPASRVGATTAAEAARALMGVGLGGFPDGIVLHQVLHRQPHLPRVLFDAPSVAGAAKGTTAAAGLKGRCDTAGEG
jgi:hypothetical protein